jgi:hypothetical protein
MVVIQADMWSTADPTAHFADTKGELARLAIKFPGQSCWSTVTAISCRSTSR